MRVKKGARRAWGVPKGFVNQYEAARLMRMTRQQVWRLVNKGVIPEPFRHGPRQLIWPMPLIMEFAYERKRAKAERRKPDYASIRHYVHARHQRNLGKGGGRPYRESWWERWNRESGTSLTKADADRISRRSCDAHGGNGSRPATARKKRKADVPGVLPGEHPRADRSQEQAQHRKLEAEDG